MNAVISALRSAVGNDKKHKATLNKIRDAFKAVEADGLSRSEMVGRGVHLADVISESVTNLHKTRPRPTLTFCAAVVKWLFEAKLEPTLERGDEDDAKAWEDILFRGLMQPILSIVDSEDQDLDVVGDVLYREICGIMRSPWGQGFGGPALRGEQSGTPQVFMTKDVSYCGTRFTQTPPSNVIILDHENLCIVFCDKNGENDVLAVATTTIKSVELIPQAASRIIVELVVAELPLVSSSREELAIPDSHIPGSPLRIRLSIASSDIFGLEAALAARDLAGVLKDDNALTRHSSLASAKISNAVFRVPLRKNRNPSNEQAEEMIRKYVNLPSSRDASSPSPPDERNKPTTRTAQSRSLPPRAPVAPATATRLVASPQVEKRRDEPPFAQSPVDEPASRLPISAPASPTPAIKLAVLADLDNSELTDPGTPPEHPGQQAAAKALAEDVPALPTPPRTRARAQPTKPVAKTLVPATPTRDDIPRVSSPSDVPSPSPKPVKKRKLVEDDPFELPPLKPDHPTKRKKTEDVNIPSNSQHIRPRDTAATRAKAKYGTISKRMRASSPIESVHSTDTEGEDLPQKKAPSATKGKKRASVKNTATAETQSRVKKNDKSDVPKRQTRAGAAKAKAKSVSTVETMGAAQNKVSKLNAAFATETEGAEMSEPPKKRGRPPKNKPPVQLPEPPSEVADSIEQASPQPESQTKSTHIEESDKTEPTPATIAPETTVAIQEEAPEGILVRPAYNTIDHDTSFLDDDLLKRLSQAAKKALGSPIMDNQTPVSSRRSPSPVKTPEVEMEHPEVDVGTVEPPVQGLETRSSEGESHQTRNTTPQPLEISNIHPTAKPPSARREKGPKGTNASTGVSTELSDVPGSSTSKSKNRPSVIQASTELQATKDIPTNDARDGTSRDIIDTNKTTSLSTRPTRNAEQAEEMIRKYVNLPSSRDASSPSPPDERNKPTTRTAQSRSLPPRAPVAPATATRLVASPQVEKLRDEPPFAPSPVDGPASRLPIPAPAGPTPVKPAGPAMTRTKRTAAEKSQKAIKLAVLADLDNSELTDPGTPSEHPEQQTAAKTPAEDVPVLPTPPRTRARAQPTKPVAKTLVPATPTRDDIPQVSSPSDVPSPSPKPVKKRKLVEDDPFELPPLKPDHPTKRKKTEDANVPSNSQHIRPRDTAATRAKAKYGTISKRMRASSPIESVHSTDTEGEDLPQKKAPAATKGKKRVPVKNTTTAETQSRVKKNDKSDVPKRQTRAGAAKAKAKSVSTAETMGAAQNKVFKLNAVFATETEGTEVSEPPKKRGRPPKNKPTRQPLPPNPNLKITSPRNLRSLIDESDKAEPTPATIAPETTVAIQEEVPEGILARSAYNAIEDDTSFLDDDLLERLSQAAKKALRSPIMDKQTPVSSRRSPSPVKTPEVEMEHPEVDVSTVEPPVQGLETRSSEGESHQTRNTTPQPLEISNIHPTAKPPGARREKGPKVFTSVDLVNSDVEMEPSRELASHQANVKPIQRPSVLTSRITPTTRPSVKPQSHPALAPASAKVKHAAVTRVLFDTSIQPSPKSALASPQRRTLANGTRPSVSFLEPPAPISRRGSSSSSTEEVRSQRMYSIDRKKLREEHSAHTGDAILQITDVMTEIQETIIWSLGEKIQIVNAEARSTRAELTKGVIEELDKMKVESDLHHNVLHKFESAFASQTQAMLEGLGRVVEYNDRMDTGIGNILTANARAGQNVARNALNFQVPELFGAFLTS
ncbi:hypothetical protein RSAG8_02137, partial [Rhizoctonia solani AG-8 WAC10335]